MKIGNDVTADRKLRACRAILLYEDNSTALATIHEICHLEEEQPPILLPGKLLTRETLSAMVRKLSGLPQTRFLLPENVLCYEGGRLIWWIPESKRPIFFQTAKKEWNQAMSGKPVLHPSLVFCAEGGRLSVFALQQSRRPKAETVLYRAPYYNLYSEGNMCAGNAKMPEVALPLDIPLWETAFFETNFTHTNLHGATKLVNHSEGHDGFWRAMAKKIVIGSPGEYLVPLDLTLEGLVNR